MALIIAVAGVLLGPTVNAADTVTITVEGSITPSCALAGLAASANLGNIQSAGNQSFSLTVDCNAPFSYSLASLNGGLKHTSISSAPSGFLNLLGYSAQMTIPTNSGAGIDDTCQSSTIKTGAVTCSFTNSGTAVAINKTATLKVAWPTSSTPLLAGIYQDTITVTVTVRP